MLALKELQRRFIERIRYERRKDEAWSYRIAPYATGSMFESCVLGLGKNVMART